MNAHFSAVLGFAGVSAAILTVMLTGCSGSSTSSPAPESACADACFHAVIHRPDGTTFPFDESATVALSDRGSTTVSAHDSANRYSFTLSWEKDAVSAPGDYDVGLKKSVHLLFGHPKPETYASFSTTLDTTLRMDEVGYQHGAVIRGTIAALEVHPVEPEEIIRVTDVAFVGRVR